MTADIRHPASSTLTARTNRLFLLLRETCPYRPPPLSAQTTVETPRLQLRFNALGYPVDVFATPGGRVFVTFHCDTDVGRLVDTIDRPNRR